ncbi:LicD family-domain-containing protein [Cladochytrium replicatum]|nr:LicD family-domain-containing protein [Cladochytrium replicatum]
MAGWVMGCQTNNALPIPGLYVPSLPSDDNLHCTQPYCITASRTIFHCCKHGPLFTLPAVRCFRLGRAPAAPHTWAVCPTLPRKFSYPYSHVHDHSPPSSPLAKYPNKLLKLFGGVRMSGLKLICVASAASTLVWVYSLSQYQPSTQETISEEWVVPAPDHSPPLIVTESAKVLAPSLGASPVIDSIVPSKSPEPDWESPSPSPYSSSPFPSQSPSPSPSPSPPSRIHILSPSPSPSPSPSTSPSLSPSLSPSPNAVVASDPVLANKPADVIFNSQLGDDDEDENVSIKQVPPDERKLFSQSFRYDESREQIEAYDLDDVWDIPTEMFVPTHLKLNYMDLHIPPSSVPSIANQQRYTNLGASYNFAISDQKHFFEDLSCHHLARKYSNMRAIDYDLDRGLVPDLAKIVASWSAFTEKHEIPTWMAHGTLLGWFWNRQLLPWDTDLDFQVPVQSLATLTGLNMTRSPDKRYVLEVNPHSAFRIHQHHNVIDARWIDTRTGLFLDITALSITMPMETYRNNANSGFARVACKSTHQYEDYEISPLVLTTLEGAKVWRPARPLTLLRREYSEYSMSKRHWYYNNEKFVFDESELSWKNTEVALLVDAGERKEAQKMAKEDWCKGYMGRPTSKSIAKAALRAGKAATPKPSSGASPNTMGSSAYLLFRLL